MSLDIEINREVLGRSLTISCTRIGRDYCIIFRGGDLPHVGAIALAEPCYISGEANASVSSICALSHRDDVLARQIALCVCKSMRAVVAVSGGIHYDGLDKEGIYTIVQTTDNMVEELIQVLSV
jgi:hypothetical protein